MGVPASRSPTVARTDVCTNWPAMPMTGPRPHGRSITRVRLVAASAGAILVTRLMKRGCAGVVTDGGFRDSAEIARLGFPAFHHRPSAPTNLTLHQAIEINVPIGCGDAPVFPGDVILGDSDGVIVIPAHLAEELAAMEPEVRAERFSRKRP